MSEPPDMDAPVTRREMHEALEVWARAVIDRMTARTTSIVEVAVAAMRSAVQASEHRLTDELRRHTKASEDELTSRLTVIDDKYKDLPARVSKLEAKTAAGPSSKRQRRKAR
jgi:hypothetical protein